MALTTENVVDIQTMDIALKEERYVDALFYAIRLNNIGVVRSLFKVRKVTLDVRNEYGDTPLLYALLFGNLELVFILIRDLQASLNDICSEGKNVLMRAVPGDGNYNIYELVLKSIKDPDYFRYKHKDYGNIVHYILGLWYLSNSTKENCLKLLKENTDSKLFAELINTVNDKDESPLLIAVKLLGKEEEPSLDFLVTNGANVNPPFKNAENCPLIYATRKGKEKVVTKLLRLGADPAVRDEKGNTLLMIAAENYDTDHIELFTRCGFSLEAVNSNNDTALLKAVRNEERFKTRYLVEINANVTARDNAGLTPYTLALTNSFKNNASLLKLLDPSTRVKTLIESATLDDKGKFFQAIIQGDLDRVEFLMDWSDGEYLDFKYEKEYDAFFIALLSKQWEIFKWLVQYYINKHECMHGSQCDDCAVGHAFNRKDQEGYTILQHAVLLNALPMVQFLVERGIIIEKTTLTLAEKNERLEILQYFKKIFLDRERLKFISGLSLPPGPLTLDCFTETIKEKVTIAAKGFCLLAHHNDRKHGCKIFVAVNKEGFVRALNVLEHARSGTEFTLIFKFLPADWDDDDDDMHMVALKMEKRQNQNHIIYVDSLGTNPTYGECLMGFMSEKCSEDFIKNTHFYRSNIHRQTDCFSCPVFAVKDAFKLSRTIQFVSEIQEGQYITSKEQDNKSGLNIYYFNLPGRFMHLTQSPDSLSKFIEEDPIEKYTCLYSGDKDDEYLDLMDFSNKPRKLAGKEYLALEVPNKHFTSDESTPNISKTVFKSQVVQYFREKYTQKILPDLLQDYSEDELVNIIRYYDVNNLGLDMNRNLNTKIELKIMKEMQMLKDLPPLILPPVIFSSKAVTSKPKASVLSASLGLSETPMAAIGANEPILLMPSMSLPTFSMDNTVLTVSPLIPSLTMPNNSAANQNIDHVKMEDVDEEVHEEAQANGANNSHAVKRKSNDELQTTPNIFQALMDDSTTYRKPSKISRT